MYGVVKRREGGKADLTSCRCARSCRSGRRGGRAPSGGCHSPGFPRTPASSWTPASQRRTNPPTENPRNKPKRKAGSRGGSVLGLGRRRATKDSMGNSGILGAGESNTCVVAARTREKREGATGLGFEREIVPSCSNFFFFEGSLLFDYVACSVGWALLVIGMGYWAGH